MPARNIAPPSTYSHYTVLLTGQQINLINELLDIEATACRESLNELAVLGRNKPTDGDAHFLRSRKTTIEHAKRALKERLHYSGTVKIFADTGG